MKYIHKLPEITRLWGYDHAPLLYNKPCRVWADALSNGSVESGLMKIVSGQKSTKNGATFSRPPDSWISLDTFSLGFAHWWSSTAIRLLNEFSIKNEFLSNYAFNDAPVQDIKWLSSVITPKKGKMPHNKKYDWILSGWWEIGLHPDTMDFCVKYWLDNYAQESLETAFKYGFKNASTFAGLCRISNSRGTGGMRSMLSKCAKENKKLNEKELMEKLFTDYYKYPDRWDLIKSMKEFDCNIPNSLSSKNIKFNRSLVERYDGTKPSWTFMPF